MEPNNANELQQRLFVDEKKKLDLCFKKVAYAVIQNLEGQHTQIVIPCKPSEEVRHLYIALDESVSCLKELHDILTKLPESKENLEIITAYNINEFSSIIRSALARERDVIRKFLAKEAVLQDIIACFRLYQQTIKLPFVRCKNGLELQYLMEKNSQIHIQIMVLLWNVLDDRISFFNKLLS